MKTKITFIIICVLLLIFAVFLLNNVTSDGLQNAVYEIDENFDSFDIVTDVADVKFVLTDSNICKVECCEEKDRPHSVYAENNTLHILSKKKTFNFLRTNLASVKITVYLPKNGYSSLKINGQTGNAEIPSDFTFANADITLTTGDIDFFAQVKSSANISASTGSVNIGKISAENLNISLTTGKVNILDVEITDNLSLDIKTGKSTLTNVTCNSITSTGTTGEITLNNVFAKEDFSVTRSTGSINLNGCDGANIVLSASTGDITGTLKSPKVFNAKTSTGQLSVPLSSGNENCRITTSTGNINISVK